MGRSRRGCDAFRKDSRVTGKRLRGTYGSRNEVRQIAQRIAGELIGAWPGARVTVDLDRVDEEDAYLWIAPADPASSEKMAFMALELVNSLAARYGLWIVPRILNGDSAWDTTPRLRVPTRASSDR